MQPLMCHFLEDGLGSPSFLLQSSNFIPGKLDPQKDTDTWNSLAVQWLGLCAFTVGSMGSVSVWRTESCSAQPPPSPQKRCWHSDLGSTAVFSLKFRRYFTLKNMRMFWEEISLSITNNFSKFSWAHSKMICFIFKLFEEYCICGPKRKKRTIKMIS